MRRELSHPTISVLEILEAFCMVYHSVKLKVLKVLTDTFKGAPRQSTYALPYGVLELIAPFLGAG